MFHLITCVDALNCTWPDLVISTFAGVNVDTYGMESF